MRKPLPTTEQVLAALDRNNGNKSAAAKELGCHRDTIRKVAGGEPGPAAGGNWRETRERDTWVIESSDSRICTVEDAVKKAGVDLLVWEVERVVVNGYDVTMKLKQDGNDQPFRAQNQQIKVVLKRKVPLILADSIEPIIERIARHAPQYTYPKIGKVQDPHLLEVSIFDHHFGKLAWAPETGQNYDLKIAAKLFISAVDDLLIKSSSHPIERIVFPLGQDFFHIDNPSNTTVNGTPQHVDSRLPKMFQAGVDACVRAIDRLASVAPVDVTWVPGNHDKTTSYFLCAVLKAWYRNCDRVSVDISPTLRKYYRYGVNLIGFTHGDEEKHHDLALIMAGERKQDWADTLHHEWHTGHYHKRKETRYNAVDTHVGVVVRIIPSLSGTDYWHYGKGYVNSTRAAEAYLWSKKNGYAGHFPSNGGQCAS